MSSRLLAVTAVLIMVIGTIGVGPSGFVGTAQAATLVVDDDGADCPGAGHTTIQSAVNSASGGDTIQVCSGTYNEKVTVDVTNLMFVANGSVVMDGQAALGAAFDVEADGVVITGFLMRNYTGSVVFTRADGTTISNNRIEYSGPGAKTATKGVYLYGNRDAIVMNNVIVDVPGGPSTRGPGILARGDAKFRGNKFLKNTIIVNNTISAKRNGIRFAPDGSGSVIRNNSIYVDKVTLDGHSGILLGSVRNVVVMRNDITVRQTGEGRGITGNVRSEGNLLIDNNTVSGARYGIWISGHSNPDKPVVVQSNNVSNSGNQGIRVKDVDGTRFVDNTVTDTGGHGMVLVDSDRFRATGNVISGADWGLYLRTSTDTLIANNWLLDNDRGLRIEDTTDIEVSENVIVNVTTGVRVVETSSPGLADSRLHDNVVLNASSEAVKWEGATPNTTVTNLTLDSAVIDFEAADVTLQAVETPPDDPLGRGSVGHHVAATSLSESAFLNLTATYTDGAATAVNESTIAIWTFDGSAWSGVANSTVDADANRVAANVTSFSTIAPLGTLTDSTTPDVSNVTVDIVDTRTISISLESNESLAVIEAEITNGTGAVVKTLTAADFGSVGTDPVEYVALTALPSAGTYTVTLTNASDQAVNDGSSGENATVQFVVDAVSITHVNGTAPDMSNLTSNVYLTQGPGGLLQVQLRDASDPTADLVNRTDLENLGVGPDTTLAINVTLVNWTPRLLLGTGHDLNWSTTTVGPNTTTLNLTVKPAETQLIESQLLNPDQPWPTGASDRADVRLNATVDLAVDDMGHLADPAQRNLLNGTILATDAQAFGSLQYDAANESLGLFVAGPHLTVDGENHTGFYDAFLPDALLDEWGVDDPGALTVAFEGDERPFESTAVAGGVELSVELTYSAGTVTISPVEPGEPSAAFTHDPEEPTVGEEVTFDAGDAESPNGEILEYRWDFTGDGRIDETTSNPVTAYTYDAADTYEVTLEITDEADAEATASGTLTVAAESESGSESEPGSDTDQDAEPESDPEPDEEPEQTRTVEVDDSGDNVTVRKTVEVANASANTTVSLDVSVEPEDDPDNATEEHPVTLDRLNVTMNRTADISLTITESAEPPTEDSATFEVADGTEPLGYIRIDHELDDEAVGEVELEFRVRKALLDEAGDDPEHVALYRLEGDEWAELPTELVGETDTHYVFRAVSPGLSEFATGAKRAQFEIADAQVSVTELYTGDDFEVVVRITNTGGVDGTYTAGLWVEGDQVAEEIVTVATDGTRQVTFEYGIDTPGSYEVRVNDHSTGQIHVLEVTPTPEATPTQTAAPAETPDGTETEPPDEPLTSPLPGFGMGVALVALAIAALLAVRRRG